MSIDVQIPSFFATMASSRVPVSEVENIPSGDHDKMEHQDIGPEDWDELCFVARHQASQS